MAAVVCARSDCSNLLPAGQLKYCSDRCGNTVRARRKRKMKKADADLRVKTVNREFTRDTYDAMGRTQARKPPQWFIDEQWPARIDTEGLSFEQVADLCGTTRPTISRWIAWLQANSADALRRQGVRANVPDGILDDFVAFRDRYFRLPAGGPYLTEPFHLRWVAAILDALEHGRQQVILSPPRHGKTELLVHVAVWLICRDPNLRVIWVGGNEDIAANASGLVLQELDSNERLVDEWGPFKPETRSGKKWTAADFTVATRSAALKSPTMIAVGKGGKLLSRDADLIVADDIEDDRTTAQPAQREATRRWFNKDLASRKEEHTAWFVIGSRQDPDDLYQHLLDNSEWDVIVEQAHDDSCAVPVEDEDAHQDCVLFPAVRSYRWLAQKRRTVGDAIFEMQYLNRPRPEGMAYFTRETVEGCRNRSRILGDIPPRTRLIAGLDPAPKGYQAAVLWAVNVDTNTRFLVDLDNEKAGGTPHLRHILAHWASKYGVVEWVVEENYRDDKIETDPVILELRQRLSLRFPPFRTGHNKNDPNLGVTSMIPLFEQGLVDLPYGDPATRAKVDVYVNQLVNWRPIAGRLGHKHWKADLVMAGWFPEAEIQGWQRQVVADMQVEYGTTGYVGDYGEDMWSR